MNLNDITISEYALKVNSERPTITAGPTLAVSGALGLSLLGLATKVTLKKFPAKDLQLFADSLDKLFAEMLNLAEEDIKNFSKISKKEKGAVEKAIQIPLDLAILSFNVYEQFNLLIEKCYDAVRGDAEAGMLLLKACCEGSLGLAKENLNIVSSEKQQFYLKKITNIEERLWRNS